MAFTLRSYQTKSIEALYHYFKQGNEGNPLVVMPTGAGKSLVIAGFIKRALTEYPGTRIMVVSHVKELLAQNADKLERLWPECDVGVYSAGLRRRDTDNAVVVAGIQSVYKRAHEFGRVHLVLIDECHLIPNADGGMYRQFLESLEELNPGLKAIGLTATPYRMDTGVLHKGRGRLFTDIVYDVQIADLVRNGYLCPLLSNVGKAKADLSGVKIRGGEYVPGSLEGAMDKEALVQAAVAETIERCGDRNKWLLFCSGVDHAVHVAEELQRQGVPTGCVHGETPAAERAQILEDFKSGELRAVTNMNVLTTGFDAPNIDAIVMLRPTLSTGLYVQMVGRGLRIDPSKVDTLVLDFAENVVKHGPIDKIQVDHAKEKGVSTQPMRECPECREVVPISARECFYCGAQLMPELDVEEKTPKHAPTATGGTVMAYNAPVEELEVDRVTYSEHKKTGKPPSLRVEYHCGGQRFSEWICLQHGGYARTKAVSWWERRYQGGVPETVQQALSVCHSVATPSTITLSLTEKFPRIISHGGLGDGPSGSEWVPSSSRFAALIPADEVPF